MIGHLSQDLQCSENQLNIKATTTEKLGFTGRGEGIACHVVVLLTALEG
jgi:2-C-methyl-D-erythritol 2,4-cyclodiphosphate synthase